MLDAKCLRCSQTVIVTKFPLRALFPLPNRVLPKLRAATMEAHLSESQTLNLTGGGESGRLTHVFKVSSNKKKLVEFALMFY